MNKIYLFLVGALFAVLTVVFVCFPRPVFSELEKRDLAVFPIFSMEKLADGAFTSEVSSWFSDSEPYRDQFMQFSMTVKNLIHITTSDDNITFHAPAQKADESNEDDLADEDCEDADTAQLYVPAEENAKIANNGILIIGQGEKVRALMAYGGSGRGCAGYAEAANKYKETFPNVNIYCMVIPTSVEFYCPEKARKCTNPQRPTIDNVIAHLSPDVKPVDIYYTLHEHADEDIFLRTDHHWAPLGAFYAAKQFAKVAGVPFRELDGYEQHVIHGYVGSMYGYSQDIAVKNAPEDFVYYTPTDVTYETTYINYTINEDYHVTGEGKPYKSVFFFRYKDGSSGAYCTFMGGDTKLTRVVTGTKNGRRLIILKDSFGNALPGYLFYSFEEVHIIDSRYFTKNMVDYVNEHHITDILFANNIFKAYSSYTYRNYTRFLTQKSGIYHPKAKPTPTDSIDSVATAVQAAPVSPVTTINPEVSENPEAPANHETPETSETPETPEVPEAPVIPEVPAVNDSVQGLL